MNRTRQLTLSWLKSSRLTGDARILEALLRRGFLAFRDDEGIWLGSGSHPLDIQVLAGIEGLGVTQESREMGHVKVSAKRPVQAIADAILSLPEHHIDCRGMGFTSLGIPNLRPGWKQYRRMVWGAKLPVCALDAVGHACGYGALDLGVALLIKALPLVRVATAYSCDGHGVAKLHVGFHFPWDASWCREILDRILVGPRIARWEFRGYDLFVHPSGGYGDSEVTALLNEVQRFARSLLNLQLIEAVAKARADTLAELGELEPTMVRFEACASKNLQAVLGSLSPVVVSDLGCLFPNAGRLGSTPVSDGMKTD